MNFQEPFSASTHSSGLRAGDAEREQAADALRRHHAEGRLSDTEFEQRVARCYAARTIGELDHLFADLPRGGRGLQTATGPHELLRGAHPVAIIAAALVALWALGGLFAATAGPWGWGAPGRYPHPFLLPLIVVAFVAWRLHGRRARRRGTA